MTELTKLHDPASGPMLIAALMSGSGTNIRRVLELERRLEQERGRSPFEVVVILSDNEGSNAGVIGKEYGIDSYARNFKEFKALRKGEDKWKVREAFDRQTVELLKPTGATVAAYGGYMLITTQPLIDAFLGVNVHPADLSVLDERGERKYIGAHAVRDTIAAGEKVLRATTHIVESQVDQGRILMVSRGLPVDIPEEYEQSPLEEIAGHIADDHQSRLKQVGDWDVFPKTLLYLAEGRYAKDVRGTLYFDGKPIPNGVRLD